MAGSITFEAVGVNVLQLAYLCSCMNTYTEPDRRPKNSFGIDQASVCSFAKNIPAARVLVAKNKSLIHWILPIVPSQNLAREAIEIQEFTDLVGIPCCQNYFVAPFL